MGANVALPDKWWQDKDAYVRVLAEHGTPMAAANATGASVGVIRAWRAKHGLPKFQPGPTAKITSPVEPVADPDEQAVLAALAGADDHASIEQLANVADMAPRRVREALERLGHEGYRVETHDDQATLARFPTETGQRHKLPLALLDGQVMRFGIVSDTHLGSVAEHPETVHLVYDLFEREGIRTVYHAGDLVDGMGVFRNHNVEVTKHTYEDQVAHAAEVYPVRDGITTFLIGGNHDLEGDFGKAGANPVQAVVNRRDDMEYLGNFSAWVDLPNGATMHLLHPQGGASYATSYRPQKIAESYEAGSKPNVLVIGHWHRTGYFPVRGIQTLLAGTHQGPTTFSTRRGMGEAGWGSWLIELTLADDGSVVRFKPEWLPVYPGRTAN